MSRKLCMAWHVLAFQRDRWQNFSAKVWYGVGHTRVKCSLFNMGMNALERIDRQHCHRAHIVGVTTKVLAEKCSNTQVAMLGDDFSGTMYSWLSAADIVWKTFVVFCCFNNEDKRRGRHFYQPFNTINKQFQTCCFLNRELINNWFVRFSVTSGLEISNVVSQLLLKWI